MKTKFLISILLLSLGATAQEYGKKWSQNDKPNYPFVSVIVDPRCLIIGSDPTNGKSSLDATIQIGANVNGLEIGVEYESHQALNPDFHRYGLFVNYGRESAIRDVYLYAGVSYGSIIREGNSNFFTFGASTELRYDFSDRFTIGLLFTFQERKDIEHYSKKVEGVDWRFNGGVKAQIKLN